MTFHLGVGEIIFVIAAILWTINAILVLARRAPLPIDTLGMMFLGFAVAVLFR